MAARWRRWPLWLKMALTSTALIAMTLGLVVSIFVRRERQALEGELRGQAALLLEALAASQADAIYRLDVGGLQDALSLLRQNQSLVSARIYDSDGRIIADAFGSGALFRLGPDPLGKLLTGSDSVRFEWTSDALLAGRSVLAGREILGAVSVGLSTESLVHQVTEIRLRGAAVAAALLLGGLAAAVVVSRGVTRTLREVTEGVRRVSGGELNQTVPAKGHDEVGKLAVAFNDMSGHLRTEIARREQMEGAVREERMRAAQEMHDGLAQIPAYLNVETAVISTLIENGQIEQARCEMQKLRDTSREMSSEIRESILGLRIASSDADDVWEKFSGYLRGFALRNGLEIVIDGEEQLNRARFDPMSQHELIRIIQEAITNVAKHARSAQVRIVYETEDGAMRVMVQDGGRGFDVDSAAGSVDGHVGIQTMQERAASIGGKVTIRSSLGTGTCVTVTIPYVAGSEAARSQNRSES